jgi:hypothetical protein
MNVAMKLVVSFCGPQVPKVLATFATDKIGHLLLWL